MNAVRVRLHGNPARTMGRSVVEVSGDRAPTVRKLIEELIGMKPDLRQDLLKDGEVGKGVLILVNGRNIAFIQGLETRVGGGDTVDIIPMVVGG